MTPVVASLARGAPNASVFQVFFDEADAVEFIELSAGEQCVALYRGVRVLDLPATEAIDLVSQHAEPVDENGDATSIVLPTLELSLWRPFAPYGPGDDIFDAEEDWRDGFEPIDAPASDSTPDGSTFATIGVGSPRVLQQSLGVGSSASLPVRLVTRLGARRVLRRVPSTRV
jgi:hypothetical protein